MSDVKELVEKLKAGVINTDKDSYNYDDFYTINIDATEELMQEAANALDYLKKKREPLSDNEISEGCPYRIDVFKSTFLEGARYAEKAHKIGIGNE